jgi:hypothetical protein
LQLSYAFVLSVVVNNNQLSALQLIILYVPDLYIHKSIQVKKIYCEIVMTFQIFLIESFNLEFIHPSGRIPLYIDFLSCYLVFEPDSRVSHSKSAKDLFSSVYPDQPSEFSVPV